jgi:ABC-type dipeptide/oligopeptide/nickel transport system permease component
MASLIARLARSSMLQVIREDYIRTARAKGLGEWSVVFVHALRNALIPVVTLLGPLLAAVVTGTFIVEMFFAVPGLGRYYITSIGNRDYPVIMGTSLLFGAMIMVMNLAVDLIYSWVDPRIRLE